VTEVDRVVDSKLATRFIRYLNDLQKARLYSCSDSSLSLFRRWKKFKKKYGNDSAESQSVIGFYSSDSVALQAIIKKGFSSSRGYQKNPKSPGGRLYGKGVHLGIDPKVSGSLNLKFITIITYPSSLHHSRVVPREPLLVAC